MEINPRREKTVITIENYRRSTLKVLRPLIGVCDLCGDETRMISPAEAAALLQTTMREVFRLIESGGLHFREIADGSLLICGNSCRGDSAAKLG